MDKTQKTPINEEELKKKLTPEQYRILREKGTEAPFTSPLLDVKNKGMFSCVVCGNQLFSSDTKFDSGTGWPSFDKALPGAVEFRDDNGRTDLSAVALAKVEVACAKCGSHLGHVFNDGPANTTGKRFCINGACLLLNPKQN